MHNAIPQPPMPHWSRLLVREGCRPRLTCQKQEVNRDLVDPALSPIGQEQISHLASKLRFELEKGLPAPTKVFTSIAVRTCQSAVEVWRNVLEREVPIIAIQVRQAVELAYMVDKVGSERYTPRARVL